MKKYNSNKTCPKCDGADVGTDYHRTWGNCEWSCPAREAITFKAHLQRYCRRCGAKWIEAPLDAQVKAEEEK